MLNIEDRAYISLDSLDRVSPTTVDSVKCKQTKVNTKCVKFPSWR